MLKKRCRPGAEFLEDGEGGLVVLFGLAVIPSHLRDHAEPVGEYGVGVRSGC